MEQQLIKKQETYSELNAMMFVKHNPARNADNYINYLEEFSKEIKKREKNKELFCEIMDGFLSLFIERGQQREPTGFRAISDKKLFLKVYYGKR